MKKSRLLGAVCASIFSLISISPHAALVDNGGGLIYDDKLDITWAQPDDSRTWVDAKPWAEGLTLGGVSGWRLPYISVAAGAGPFTGSPVDCNTASETACRDNELGYMFYYNLSGTSEQPIPPNGDPDVLALFPELQPSNYWSGTEFASFNVWNFNFHNGNQLILNRSQSVINVYSWAVHAGDIRPIPVPAAVWLFGSGLLGLISIARRKNVVVNRFRTLC
jgi:hypothetical protein